MSRSVFFRNSYSAWASAVLLLLLLYPGTTLGARDHVSEDRYPHRRGRRVVFTIQAPANSSVHMMGDFNDWDEDDTALEYLGYDSWELALQLNEGVYDYKFIVDGKHLLDPSNPNEITYEDGSVRSRIKVLRNNRVSRLGRWKGRRRIPRRVEFSSRERSHLSLGGDYSFTRVDGSTFWFNVEYRSSYDFTPRLRANFGYGTESERTTVQIDFSQPLSPSRNLNMGVAYLNGTGFENQSGVGWRENTLTSLFVKHDYNDYYRIESVEPYVKARFPLYNTLRVSFAFEDYDSLTTQTDWSFFEAGRDKFRANPPLFLLGDPNGLGGTGHLQAARVEWIHDSRHARQVGTVGVYARGFLELGSGDFSYARWVGDARAYMRLGPPVHLALRFRAGSRFGDEQIPSQKLFYVGGLGTVRGHPFRSLVGDQSMLGNMEYTLLFDDLNYGLLFFYDFGTAWNSLKEDLNDATYLQSVGIGFKTADNDFQVNIAKPIGENEGNLETTIRLQRTF